MVELTIGVVVTNKVC